MIQVELKNDKSYRVGKNPVFFNNPHRLFAFFLFLGGRYLIAYFAFFITFIVKCFSVGAC